MIKNRKIGVTFWDQIEERSAKSRISYIEKFEENENSSGSKVRIYLLSIVVIAAIFLLLNRLFGLMILEEARNKDLAQQNRIKLNVIPAPRGIIYDRNGKPLVRNTAIYQQKLIDGTLKSIDREKALQEIASGDKKSASILIKTAREYIYQKAMSHLLGYLTEITKEEMQNNQFAQNNYLLGEKIGRLGIEQQYESVLKGINGKELIEVDALGRTVKKLGEQKEIAGKDVHLTIDANLQKEIADAFPEKEKGSVIASDPLTGEVLAVYSSPGFDPNLFTMPQTDESSKTLREILENKDSPLFNRAISGSFPSGSTFKIITSAAGLETGKIDKDTEIEDVGIIQIGPFKFPNWYYLQYGGKEGMVNLVKAIKRSNDIFFYKVGEMVGLDDLVKMAKRFGLSKKTGIDLPNEAKGLMPTEEWKRENIGDNWYLGDTYHLAIGQGYLLTTPLQINVMTNVIASGGRWCRPHVLSDLSFLSNLGDLCHDVGLKSETISLIKDGMHEACSTGGTGWPFFDFKVQNPTTKQAEKVEVGCKTGTAEFGDPNNNTHGWFTVFAPFDKPKITMTILVEGAGEGSNVAAPIAKKVLEQWLRSN